MSIKRWNAKRDSNEVAIVKALKQAGASVARISETGMPDLIVWYHGAIHLLEIKRAKARGQRAGAATLAQETRSAEGWPVVTVRTEEAALAAIGAIS